MKNDNNQFLFVTCVNNETYYEQCLAHIDKLVVPNGFSVEKYACRNSISMCQGYNSARQVSSAQYKIYLHQDTYIINVNILNDILKLFTHDPSLGLLGMVGCERLPKSGVWWEGKKRFGKVLEHRRTYSLLAFDAVKRDMAQVEAIDGLLMITQYDIPWNESVFDGWHFYDASQAMEYQKHGYRVGVPRQDMPWCLHDCGEQINMNQFHYYQKIFQEHYR